MYVVETKTLGQLFELWREQADDRKNVADFPEHTTVSDSRVTSNPYWSRSLEPPGWLFDTMLEHYLNERVSGELSLVNYAVDGESVRFLWRKV